MQADTSSQFEKQLQAMVDTLHQSGQYVVIKKLNDIKDFVPSGTAPEDESTLIRTIYVDTETTGVEVHDEIIQLTMIEALVNTTDGSIVEVGNIYNAYNEPSKLIPEEITALTGITNEMVEGKRFNEAEIGNFIRDCELMVAHEAKFDRGMMENNFPELTALLKSKDWACSHMDIPWKDLGVTNAKLDYLAFKAGYAYDAHRADIDTLALMQMLDTAMLNVSGAPARPMKVLYDNAMKKTCKIFATNTAFSTKDKLKARGYSWSDGTNGSHKAWFIEIDVKDERAELHWLNTEIYGYENKSLPIEYFEAKARYSDPLAPRPKKAPSFLM